MTSNGIDALNYIKYKLDSTFDESFPWFDPNEPAAINVIMTYINNMDSTIDRLNMTIDNLNNKISIESDPAKKTYLERALIFAKQILNSLTYEERRQE